MAVTKNQAFFEELLSPSAAKWSAGVAFDRSNGLPLDQWSVFQTKAKATEYLTNAKAYPGQVIAYAEDNGEMTVCVLSQNVAGDALTLKQVGIIPVGSGAINVTEAGEISVNVDNSTIKIVDGKLVAEIPEFEDTDTTYSVKENEKVLKLEGTEFSTELKLQHKDGKISLLGKNDVVISEFSDAEFVADGVLEDVSYNEETKDLVFTWNVVGEDGKKKTDTVNIADLVDVNTDTTYTVGTEDSEKKVKVTLTPSEGDAQEVEINAYNTTTMDDMLYNGKYTKKTKNDDGTTTEEEVVSNIVANKEKARLISTEEIAKLSALVLAEDGSVGVSGTISAENVTGLTDAITSQVTGANGLNIAQGAQVNAIEQIKVNGLAQTIDGKAVNIAVPTKVSDLENDKYYLVNVKMRDADDEAGYTPVLSVTKSNNVAVIDDEALQTTINGIKSTTDTAVQSATFAGVDLAKNGTKISISKEAAVEALGLKSLAFQESIDTGVHSVSLESGSNNGTIKLTVDGVATDNIPVKGLGSAAYANTDAFDAAGAAANVLGKETDAAGAVTVHGAINKAKEVLGSINDGASAMTVHGAHAAVKALTDGTVKNNAEAIAVLNSGVDKTGSVAHTAKAAADAAIANLVNNGQVKDNTQAINTLIGTTEGDSTKSVRAIAAEEVLKVVDGAPEAMNTLKEVADWIANDQTGAAGMAANIEKNRLAIEAIYTPANSDVAASGVLVAEVARIDGRIDAINNEENGILAQSKAYTLEQIEAIPAATTSALGLVKLSDEVGVTEANALEVKSLNVNKLTQTEGEWLVLNGGTSEI